MSNEPTPPLNEPITLYFTRDSFCFGDDVLAPNIAKFEWYEHYDSTAFFGCVQRYLGLNLPAFRWRGYAGGERIVDAIFRRSPRSSLSIEMALQENWKELLLREKTVWFLHCGCDEDTLPETTDFSYAYEEAQTIYKDYAPPWFRDN